MFVKDIGEEVNSVRYGILRAKRSSTDSALDEFTVVMGPGGEVLYDKRMDILL